MSFRYNIPTSILSAILREKVHFVEVVCCCLLTCNSVVNMVVMGLVTPQAMFDGHVYHWYHAKVPFYNVLWEYLCFGCCLHNN